MTIQVQSTKALGFVLNGRGKEPHPSTACFVACFDFPAKQGKAKALPTQRVTAWQQVASLP